MQIKIVQDSAARFLKENASTVLTAGGVVGTVATAVLSVRAGMKAQEIIQNETSRRYVEKRNETGDIDLTGLTKREKVVLVGPQFIPPVAVGSATIASIVMAHRISAGKAAALAAAYGMSQKHFDEYRAKVEEKLGVARSTKMQDELAQDRVKETPVSSQVIVVSGDVLCFDQPTGRYFTSTMESINRAVNAANAEIIHHDFVSASFFYDELELPPTTWTDEVGWNSDNMLELAISTVLSPEDKPCIAIDFKTLPAADYQRRMYN